MVIVPGLQAHIGAFCGGFIFVPTGINISLAKQGNRSHHTAWVALATGAFAKRIIGRCLVFYNHQVFLFVGQRYHQAGATGNPIFLMGKYGTKTSFPQAFCFGFIYRKQRCTLHFRPYSLIPANGTFCVAGELCRSPKIESGCCPLRGSNAIVGINVDERRVDKLVFTIYYHRIFWNADACTYGHNFSITDYHYGILQSGLCIFYNGGIGKGITAIPWFGQPIYRKRYLCLCVCSNAKHGK